MATTAEEEVFSNPETKIESEKEEVKSKPEIADENTAVDKQGQQLHTKVNKKLTSQPPTPAIMSDMSSLGEALPPANGRPSIPQEGERPQLEIKVMLWNINGPGSAKYRNGMVPVVVKETRPDVLLLQETTTDLLVNSIISQANGVAREYKEVKADDKTEARVLYDSRLYEAISLRDDKVFPGREGRGPISLAEALEQSIPPEEEQRELRGGRAAGGMRGLFKDRIAIVGLKRREHELVSNRVMIFMSFHNMNTSQGGDTRKKAAKGFCQIVKSMRELTGTVVIAGADLNQQMISDSPRIPQYSPTLRRISRVIDYFILDSPPGRMEPPVVTAVDFMGARDDPLNPLHRVMNDLLRPPMTGPGPTIEDYGRAIDHDPLICDILLASPHTPQGTE